MLLDSVVRIGHEVVEMDAPLAPRRQELEEHVHQHGLAATDAAMDVEAFYRRLSFPPLGEQPAERARLLSQPLGADLVGQPVERGDHFFLRRISLYRSGFDGMRIALRDRGMRLDAVAQVHGVCRE
jgi:hypothetical protein